MFFSILSLVTGVVFVQQFSVLPENKWIAIIGLLSLILSLFRCWRLMFFTMGILWALYFANLRLAERLPESLEGKVINIEGQVLGLPRYDDRRVRFDFKVLHPDTTFSGKIRLSWYFPDQQIKAGQFWQMTVKLKKPHGRLNPGGFDYERWLLIQNIGATGYVRNTPKAKLLATAPYWKNFDVIRQLISDELTALLPGSDNLGLIKALIIGERHEIKDKQWSIFRKTGTIHLIAISGLHIGLIASLVYYLTLKTAIRLAVISPQKIAAASAMIVATFYAALAGFSIPTQRALIMLIIVMLASILQRNTSIKNTLALAMLGVVLFDPFSVLSAGFWLSFLAVTLLVFILAGRLGGTASYWLNVIKIHCVMAIGLSPLLVFYFQQVSIIAPLANFIAVPVVSFLIVPLSFASVLMMAVSVDYAVPLLHLIDEILKGLWFVLSNLADLSYSDASIVSSPFYVVIFALIGLFILLSPKGIPARWLGGVLLLPLLLVKQDKQKPGDFEMTLLDVGQGLSAVIKTANHSLVFDTGAKYSSQFNMGRSVVIPFLQHKGVSKIDKLIISHGDNDHIGGAKAVIDQVRPQQILTSVPELLAPYQSVRCIAGQQWVWDQVKFSVISPVVGTLRGENNNSCVLKVSSNNKAVLLTGDIEKEAETWLLGQQGISLKSDVLIAPHHGSKTSSTLAFLKAVDPDMILIPAGYKNRYSFPHDKVIKRYMALNKAWKNTADQGAITISVKNSQVNLTTMRKDKAHYWN